MVQSVEYQTMCVGEDGQLGFFVQRNYADSIKIDRGFNLLKRWADVYFRDFRPCPKNQQ